MGCQSLSAARLPRAGCLVKSIESTRLNFAAAHSNKRVEPPIPSRGDPGRPSAEPGKRTRASPEYGQSPDHDSGRVAPHDGDMRMTSEVEAAERPAATGRRPGPCCRPPPPAPTAARRPPARTGTSRRSPAATTGSGGERTPTPSTVVSRQRRELWTPAAPGGMSYARSQDPGAEPATPADAAAWCRAGSPQAFTVRVPIGPTPLPGSGTSKPMRLEIRPKPPGSPVPRWSTATRSSGWAATSP